MPFRHSCTRRNFKRVCAAFFLASVAVMVGLGAAHFFGEAPNAQAVTYTEQTKADNFNTINKTYQFTPKWNSKTTTTTSSGWTSNALMRGSVSSSTDQETVGTAKQYSRFLCYQAPAGSAKGLWVRFNNVGTFRGKTVNLTITVTAAAAKATTGKTSYVRIAKYFNRYITTCDIAYSTATLKFSYTYTENGAQKDFGSEFRSYLYMYNMTKVSSGSVDDCTEVTTFSAPLPASGIYGNKLTNSGNTFTGTTESPGSVWAGGVRTLHNGSSLQFALSKNTMLEMSTATPTITNDYVKATGQVFDLSNGGAEITASKKETSAVVYNTLSVTPTYPSGGYRLVKSETDGAQDATAATTKSWAYANANHTFKMYVEKVLTPFSFIKTDSTGTALSGATFTLKNGSTTVGTVTSGDDGKVDFGSLAAGTYTLTETSAPGKYATPSGSWTITVSVNINTSTGALVSQDISVTPVDGTTAFSGSYAGGDFKVANTPVAVPFSFTKTDGSGAALSGATFNLKGVSGIAEAMSVNQNVTSTAAGLVDFGSLAAGTYTLTETAAPATYPLPPGSWTVVVTADDEATKSVSVSSNDGAPEVSGSYAAGFSLPNYRPGMEFSFTKTDDDGAALAGAVFQLKSGASFSTEATSGADGVVSFSDLGQGSYTLVETSPPDGYPLPQGYWTVDVNVQGQTISIAAKEGAEAFSGDFSSGFSLVNKKGAVPFSFTKQNATTGAALAGATFQLKSGDATLKTVTSTDAGLVDFGELASGTYTLVESAVPDGYVKPSGSWTIEVDALANTLVVTAQGDAPDFGGSLEEGYTLGNSKYLNFFFLKSDAETGGGVSGAVFELRDGDKVLQRQTSQEFIPIVNFGTFTESATYQLYEVQAPDGYKTPAGHWTVALDVEAGTTTITSVGDAPEFTSDYFYVVANTRVVPFSFTKTDSATGAALAGATFKLANSSGVELSTVTSGADGKVDFGNLEAGTYTLAESAAPAGYKAVEGTWTVVVDAANRTASVTPDDSSTPSFSGDFDNGFSLANEKVLPFSFTKTGEDGMTPLEGATFVLTGADGQDYTSTAVSGTDGKVSFTDFTVSGTYYLQETVAPSGYTLPSGSWTVNVDMDAGTVEVLNGGDRWEDGMPEFAGDYASGYKVANLRTVPFAFTKTDADGTTPLENAAFALYKCTNAAHTSAADHSERATNDADCCWDVDNPCALAVSDSDGLVDFGKLETGQYMLVETVPPYGYELPYGQWMIVVDASVQSIDVVACGDDLPPAFKKDAETGAYSVANYRKWTLPLAGGTGTIALTAAGAALVAAACAWCLLFARKKRSA